MFQLLVLPCQRGGWGCTRNWEGTQARQLAQAAQRDVPFHVALCWTIIWGKEEGWLFGAMVFVFPKNRPTCWALLSRKWMIPACQKEAVKEFLLLPGLGVQLLLYLVVNSFYLNPDSHTSTFLILPLSHMGRTSTRLCDAELHTWAKPQGHHWCFFYQEQKVMLLVIASFVPGRDVYMPCLIEDASLKVPKWFSIDAPAHLPPWHK